METRRSSTRRVGTARAAAAGLCLAMGALGWPGGAGAGELKKVTIFTGTTPQFANLYVAEVKGFFKDFGLDGEVKIFTSGSVATEAFMAGRGNILLAGDFPSIRVWARNPVVGIVAGANMNENSIVVGRKELKGPKDLKGKRVGVLLGSTSEFFALKYLASGGLGRDDVTLKNIPPPEMVIALEKGDIDAYVVWQPFGWQSLKVSGDKVHIMSTGKSFFTEYMVFSASKEYAQKEPEAIKALVRTIMKANDHIKANLDDGADAVAKRLKLDREMARSMMSWTRFDVAYTPEFRKSMDDLAAFMLEKKALDKPIDWAASFDPSFLRASSADLAR